MPKKKLTLSIRDDLFREVKKISLERGVSLSNIVEIPGKRPKGADSTSVIRDLRGSRWRKISGA